MMRWISFVKVSLLLLIASFIGYLLLQFTEGEREELLLPVSASIEEEVVESSEKFDLLHTRDGRPEYQLSAERVIGYRDGLTTLEVVEIRYFEDGISRSVVTANEAYYDAEKGNVRLVGDVVGRSESGLTLYGEEFLYVNEEQSIVSSHPVRFEHGTWRGKGSALRYFVQDRSVRLEDPVLEGEQGERLQALQGRFRLDERIGIFEREVSGMMPSYTIRSDWLRIRLDDQGEALQELDARGKVHLRSRDGEDTGETNFFGERATGLFSSTSDALEEIHLSNGRVRRGSLLIAADQIDMLGSFVGAAQGNVRVRREGNGTEPVTIQADSLRVNGNLLVFEGDVMSEIRPASGGESRVASRVSRLTSQGRMTHMPETLEKSDDEASAPIYIAATQLFVDEERELAIYTGSVLVTQGRNSLTASRLTLWGQRKSALAEGRVAVQLWEGDQVVEIDALQMTYDREEEQVIFLSDVAFHQDNLEAETRRLELEMDGSALQQANFFGDVVLADTSREARGENAVYDVVEGKITVQSTEGVCVLSEKVTGRKMLGKSFFFDLEEDRLRVKGDPFGRIEVKGGRGEEGGTGQE